MSGDHPHPHARPFAAAPVQALSDRTEELAKSWAIALVLALPLRRIGEIPLEDLAKRAPALIERAIRALASDAELQLLVGGREPVEPVLRDERGWSISDRDRVQPAAAERLGSLTGAHDPVAAVRAVEALRAVLWEALLQELHAPSARDVAECSDRLAHVCSAIAAAAVVHELDLSAGSSGPISQRQPQPSQPPSLAQPPSLPWDAEIEVRDARDRGGPVAWIESIGQSLDRYAEDRMPFAVLLIELVDIERLEHAQTPGELAETAGQLESALGRVLRPVDLLTRERPGRYWLLSPDTDAMGARALAERLALTVRSAASHRGTPLEASIGIAVCPEDGREASALAARADIGLYAARAAGRAVAPVDPA
jgi:GGDEF domain-containing protein